MILLASQYLTGIRDAEILPYRGETIGEFIHKIRYNIIKLNRYTHVIVHVGTNNVLNNKPVEILSLYSTLIHLIKQKYKNIIVGISSILPRPKDQIVITTTGTYPWSFVTQIFHNIGGYHKTFEVMT